MILKPVSSGSSWTRGTASVLIPGGWLVTRAVESTQCCTDTQRVPRWHRPPRPCVVALVPVQTCHQHWAAAGASRDFGAPVVRSETDRIGGLMRK